MHAFLNIRIFSINLLAFRPVVLFAFRILVFILGIIHIFENKFIIHFFIVGMFLEISVVT